MPTMMEGPIYPEAFSQLSGAPTNFGLPLQFGGGKRRRRKGKKRTNKKRRTTKRKMRRSRSKRAKYCDCKVCECNPCKCNKKASSKHSLKNRKTLESFRASLKKYM
jgi:hypothetical protein